MRMKKSINFDIEGVKGEIIYHKFNDVDVKTFLVSFSQKRRVLSTLEGFKEVNFVANNYNPPQLWNFAHKNYKIYKESILSYLDISADNIAMLFTGADMDNISIKMEEYKGIKIYACVTAGVKSNAQRIGVDKPGSIEIEEGVFEKLGTINIIILTNASLTDGAMARSLITITEAKTIAMEDLNIRSSYNPELQATGTGTDNAIIVSGIDKPIITYTGGHAKFGEMMAKAVTAATKEAILKQNGIK